MKSITPDNKASPGKAYFEITDKNGKKLHCVQQFYWDMEDPHTFFFRKTPLGFNAIKGSKFDKVL
jgi:hypothetical protein